MIERKQLVSEDKIEATRNELQYNTQSIIEARNKPDDIKGFNAQPIIESRNEAPKEGYNAQQMIQVRNSIPQEIKTLPSKNSDGQK